MIRGFAGTAISPLALLCPLAGPVTLSRAIVFELEDAELDDGPRVKVDATIKATASTA